MQSIVIYDEMDFLVCPPRLLMDLSKRNSGCQLRPQREAYQILHSFNGLTMGTMLGGIYKRTLQIRA